jgi:tryptophanyl-tRNA synthetase
MARGHSEGERGLDGQGKAVIVSGMRPTGRLHLGNYHGALENWVRLQDSHRCFYFVADWHALTTGYADTADIRENRRQLVIDWVSAGLDPERSTLFVQSAVKQHAELALLFGMVTPLGWLERVPTYKEQLRAMEGREVANLGLLGYPVLQAADICLYRADAVPVGEDQVPHIELAREIVRRFNSLYAPVFPEPEAALTRYHVLPGLDGRKMSKSYDNTILLAEEPERLRAKVASMVTDPARVRRSDPGHPEICPVYALHGIYSPGATAEIGEACRTAQIGCVDCKRRLAGAMVEAWAPHRERRVRLEAHPEEADEILAAGSEAASQVAASTMEAVNAAMRL